jgi:hypothetical protein
MLAVNELRIIQSARGPPETFAKIILDKTDPIGSSLPRHQHTTNMKITNTTLDLLAKAGFDTSVPHWKFASKTLPGFELRENRTGHLAFFSDYVSSKAAISKGFADDEELASPAFAKALENAIARHNQAVASDDARVAFHKACEDSWLATRKTFAQLLRDLELKVDWNANSDTFVVTDPVGTSSHFSAVRDNSIEGSKVGLRYLTVGKANYSGLVIADKSTALEDKAACVKKFLTCLPWFS